MWWLLFLHSILLTVSAHCAAASSYTSFSMRACAHTVILEQYAPRSTHFHSGTSRPHCAPLIDANLRPSWRSRFAVVGESEMGRKADMRSLGSLPNALCSRLQFGQVALAP